MGRQRELAELADAVDETAAGSGDVFVVWGPAGIGKTRLAQELATRATARGLLVAWGRCSDDPGSPPLWPWTQVLRELGPAEPVASLIGAPPDTELNDTTRFGLFDLANSALHNAARRQPLVLIFDDVQFADAGSVRLLEFVAPTVAGRPILLVTLGREPVGRLGRTIPLRGLSRDELEAFVREAFGLEPPQDVMASLWRLTEGNPFFADEIVRLFLSGRHRPDEGRLAVPEGVRDVIRQRLEPLTASTRGILRFASVVGQRFDPKIAGAASGQDADQVLAGLREAIEHRIVEPTANASSYVFAHALIRDALYEELGPDERARAHLAIAEAIGSLPGTDTRHRPSALAHHYLQARALVGTKTVVDHLVEAGDVALGLMAHEQARDHYSTALSLIDAASPSDDPMRARILCSLGDAQRRAGAFYRAMDAFEASAAAARTCSAPALFVRAAVRFEDVRWRAGDFTRLLRAIELLDEALEQATDEEQRAEVLSRRPLALQFTGSAPGPMVAAADEALAIAERHGDTRLLIRALEGRRAALWRPEDAEARLEATDRFAAIAASATDPEATLLAAIYRFCDQLVLGHRHAMEGQLLATEDAFRAARVPWLAWWPPAMHATVALMQGDLEAAKAHATSVSDAVPERDDQLGVGAAALIQALYGWEKGEGSLVRASLDTMNAMIPVSPIRHVFDAFADVACGREADATRALEAVATGGFAGLVHGPARRPALMAILASVCSRLHDADRATEIYESLLTVPTRVLLIVPLPALLTTPHWLGVLAATIGRTEDARRHFEEAIAFHERLGAAGWVARSRLECGKALADDPASRAEGLALLDAARGLASKLGLTAVAAEAEDRLAGAAPSAAAADPNVFRREGETWLLTHRGRSVRLPDLKGLRYLSVLLASPSKEVHVLRLPVLAEGSVASPPPDVIAAGLRPEAGAGDRTLDPPALAAYRRRLDELADDAAEAEMRGDPDGSARAREESDWIARELSRSLGLRGHDRRPGTPVEKTRVNVQRAIRTAIARISSVHPLLADHLTARVRTGTFCVYLGGPDAPIWSVGTPSIGA